MAQIVVCADFLANRLPKLHQSARIIDGKVRVHLQREAFDAMRARIFRRLFPVPYELFFPLPVLHLRVLGMPAIRDPVRLSVLWCAARAAGEANDDFYLEHFCEEDGLLER